MYRRRMFLTLTLLALIGLLMPFGPVRAVRLAGQLDTDAIDEFVAQAMADYGVPGLSLAVIQDGEVRYAKGYGVRDVRTGEPMTPETQTSIGSITKSFTALAAAQLVEAGKLDLDTPIRAYVPEFTLSDAAAADKLTMRHLLSNRAGFATDDAYWYTGQLQADSQDGRDGGAALLKHIAALPMQAQPGVQYEYNNLGYALAGLVIERVSGLSWAEYVRERILTPLKMDAATTDFAAMEQGGNYATPHALRVREGMQAIPRFPYLASVAPAGAINASALEMANYALVQINGGQFEGRSLVSEALIRELHTPPAGGEYALGWSALPFEGANLVWHNGSISGYGAMLATEPSRKAAVIALMNADYDEQSGFLDALTLYVMAVALDLPLAYDVRAVIEAQIGANPAARAERFQAARAFKPDQAAYTDLVGEYSTPLGTLTLRLEAGKLLASQTLNGMALEAELIEFAPDQFVADHPLLINRVFQVRREGGRIVILQDGQPVATKG